MACCAKVMFCRRNRQAERREDILQVLRTKGYTRLVDLSGEEQQGRYFEVPLCSVRRCLDHCSLSWAKTSDTSQSLTSQRVQMGLGPCAPPS